MNIQRHRHRDAAEGQPIEKFALSERCRPCAVQLKGQRRIWGATAKRRINSRPAIMVRRDSELIQQFFGVTVACPSSLRRAARMLSVRPAAQRCQWILTWAYPAARFGQHNSVVACSEFGRLKHIMVKLASNEMLAGLRAELGLRPMAEFDPDVPSRVYDSLNEEFFDWEPVRYAADYRKWARPFRGTDEMEWDGLMLLGWRPL
jgi:hypothetical protein